MLSMLNRLQEKINQLENDLKIVRGCNEENIIWKNYRKNRCKRLEDEKLDKRLEKITLFKRKLNVVLQKWYKNFEIADKMWIDRSILSAVKKGHYKPNEPLLDIYIKKLECI